MMLDTWTANYASYEWDDPLFSDFWRFRSFNGEPNAANFLHYNNDSSDVAQREINSLSEQKEYHLELVRKFNREL